MFLRAFGLFLTVIRLFLGQLWAILGRTAPPTHVTQFRPVGYWEPRNEVGSLSPVERLVGFNCNALTH